MLFKFGGKGKGLGNCFTDYLMKKFSVEMFFFNNPSQYLYLLKINFIL